MKIHLWSPEVTTFGYGIAAFTRALAVALLELGHDLRLLAKQDPPGSWHGCPLAGAGNFPRPLRAPVFAAIALAMGLKHRPDHVISAHVNFGPVAHWAKRAFGTPFTLVAYGIDVHDGLAADRQAALRAADRVMVISNWTRDRVLRLGVNASRVSVVPVAVDHHRFSVAERPAELIRRYNLKADEKLVLSLARLNVADRYKGQDRIVTALPAIRSACGPVRFLVAGQGDDLSRLEELAVRLGVRDAVTFTGFVPESELADHYRLADVFAMPSTGEGFGIVFLEAMSCGTPVLAGNCDGSVDALEGGRLGRLVDPTDPRAIADGIIGLLNRQGPDLWFDPPALHAAVATRFGPSAFRERLREALAS